MNKPYDSFQKYRIRAKYTPLHVFPLLRIVKSQTFSTMLIKFFQAILYLPKKHQISQNSSHEIATQ